MRIIDLIYKKYTLIITNRIALFFLLLCILSAFLYVLGTVQGFMDDTQFFLLGVVRIGGILLAVISIVTVILAFIFYFRNKSISYLSGVFLHLFLAIFGAGVSFAASFIVIISGGI